jgi:hypothetical protein
MNSVIDRAFSSVELVTHNIYLQRDERILATVRRCRLLFLRCVSAA